jgi:hypothetical protein
MVELKSKIWIGNLDGRRQGLVRAPTKKRALEAILATGASITFKDFNDHWHEWTHPGVIASIIGGEIELDMLYTRPFDARTGWHKGKCAL